jgi:hypothetical protein
MAIQSVIKQMNPLPTIDELVERTGMDRESAALHLLVLSGEAMTNDLEFIPEGQRVAILREEEANEAAFIAALERAAELVDPTATVDENVARTGLDREKVELYLTFLATRS